MMNLQTLLPVVLGFVVAYYFTKHLFVTKSAI